MKTIDLEAHFITEEFLKMMYENRDFPRYVKDKQGRTMVSWSADATNPIGNVLLNKLLDIGDGRLKEMDEAGIDVQVLTLPAPGVELFDPKTGTALAKKTNDLLSEVIQKHPDRYLGFAALAPNDPEAAADELERAVKELGLKGWKTHSNYGDSYLDESKYWPILEKAAELNVPVYLHPSFPAISQLRTSYGFALAGAAFGFGFETAMCMMRLILSGLFDRYPGLKIILGHLGEALPFLHNRMDHPYLRSSFQHGARPHLNKRPSEYMQNNVFVTTSGNYHIPAFFCTSETLGIEKIMLGTDYPYEHSLEGIKFIESLSLSPENKAKIYEQNARQLGLTI